MRLVGASRPAGWNDWKWQLSHRITSAEALGRVLPLTGEDKTAIETCLEAFRMAVTPYYA